MSSDFNCLEAKIALTQPSVSFDMRLSLPLHVSASDSQQIPAIHRQQLTSVATGMCVSGRPLKRSPESLQRREGPQSLGRISERHPNLATTSQTSNRPTTSNSGRLSHVESLRLKEVE
jgi:hypothetical protein